MFGLGGGTELVVGLEVQDGVLYRNLVGLGISVFVHKNT
jgi:hypothetical protein